MQVLEASDEGLLDEVDSVLVSNEQPLVFMISNDQQGLRWDVVLAQLLPAYSRGRIQQWIQAGAVTVSGRVVKAKSRVIGGEEVVVIPLLSPEQTAFQAEPLDLDILYTDEEICVLNKSAGLVVHPAAGNWSGTLLNGLLHHFPESNRLPRAGIVHRLDKDTTGLMVVARTEASQLTLVKQLQAHTVLRMYIALVWGDVTDQVVDLPIARHSRDRLRMAVQPGGKAARTHVVKLWGNGRLSLVACRLETGRTHQIRVHLSHIGHPLVGDPLYGVAGKETYGLTRQALHAIALGLYHPTQHVFMSWHSELPDDLLTVLAQLDIPWPCELPWALDEVAMA